MPLNKLHPMTTEHLPFMVDSKDFARILGLSKPTFNRRLLANAIPVESLRLGERIVMFKRPDIEAWLGAPLSDLAPWLVSEKEPA